MKHVLFILMFSFCCRESTVFAQSRDEWHKLRVSVLENLYVSFKFAAIDREDVVDFEDEEKLPDLYSQHRIELSELDLYTVDGFLRWLDVVVLSEDIPVKDFKMALRIFDQISETMRAQINDHLASNYNLTQKNIYQRHVDSPHPRISSRRAFDVLLANFHNPYSLFDGAETTTPQIIKKLNRYFTSIQAATSVSIDSRYTFGKLVSSAQDLHAHNVIASKFVKFIDDSLHAFSSKSGR